MRWIMQLWRFNNSTINKLKNADAIVENTFNLHFHSYFIKVDWKDNISNILLIMNKNKKIQ